MVTPCVGVWIETAAMAGSKSPASGSHPAWVCGLKRRIYDEARSYQRHTLRGCVD